MQGSQIQNDVHLLSCQKHKQDKMKYPMFFDSSKNRARESIISQRAAFSLLKVDQTATVKTGIARSAPLRAADR